MNEGDLHNSLASLAVKVYGCHKYSSGFLGRNPCANNGRRAAAAEPGGSEQLEQQGPRCPALGTPGTQEGPGRGWLGQRQKVQQVNNNGQEEREGLTGLVHLREEPWKAFADKCVSQYHCPLGKYCWGCVGFTFVVFTQCA